MNVSAPDFSGGVYSEAFFFIFVSLDDEYGFVKFFVCTGVFDFRYDSSSQYIFMGSNIY